MDWLIDLYSFVASLALKIYRAADWLEEQFWPLNLLAPRAFALADVVREIYFTLTTFARWVLDLEDRIRRFVTQSWVRDFFSDPLYHLNQLWVWFSDKVSWVGAVISNWWAGVKPTVLAWVETAKTYALGLVLNLQGVFNTLQSRWNNFWTVIFPTLASRLDVDDMIKNAFAPWTDLFNFWGQFSQSATNFFLHPLDFLLEAFTGWFLGEE